MKCRSCGAEVSAEKAWCPQCNQPLEDEETREEVREMDSYAGTMLEQPYPVIEKLKPAKSEPATSVPVERKPAERKPARSQPAPKKTAPPPSPAPTSGDVQKAHQASADGKPQPPSEIEKTPRRGPSVRRQTGWLRAILSGVIGGAVLLLILALVYILFKY